MFRCCQFLNPTAGYQFWFCGILCANVEPDISSTNGDIRMWDWAGPGFPGASTAKTTTSPAISPNPQTQRGMCNFAKTDYRNAAFAGIVRLGRVLCRIDAEAKEKRG